MRRRLLLTALAPLVAAATLALSPTGPAGAGQGVHAPRVPSPTPWSGPGPATPTTPGSLSTELTPVRRAWSSANWSGYAISGSGFHSAVGSWHVPTVIRPATKKLARKNLFSGTWVGIDGFNDRNLIQAGTEEDWLHGTASYQAWWEILPAPETPIPASIITVHPGDAITVSITRGLLEWTIQVTDATTHRTFTTQQGFTGPMTSVEWIHEAVTVGRHISKMPHDSTFAFDASMVNGAPADLVSSEAGSLVQGGGRVSTPSAPDSDHDGFTVAYGSAAPRAPAS